ncbi:MAG: twin-arginine translocase TatA/TatE family subunit [Chloroflexota bacterium]|nr:twin-arginine translocase TatA/TatE family subunit [Chloroflexota bacterium]
MDMLNVGGGELLLVLLIGLLFFGPEELLKIARTVGSYLRQSKTLWSEILQALETDNEELGGGTDAGSQNDTA